MQGPGVWLANLGIELPGFLDPSAKAVYDEDHRVFLNYENFYFGHPAAAETFRAAPHEVCGLVTDPVTKKRFRPDAASSRLDREGRILLFANPENLAIFEKDPETYEAIRIGMVETE